MDWVGNKYCPKIAFVAFFFIGMLQAPVLAKVTDVPDMPHPRVGMCSAIYENTVYLIGGAQNLQGRNFANLRGTSAVQAFNLETLSWETNVAPLETPRVFACAVAMDDSIYVMGGVDSLGNVLSSVEVYDPSANRWHYTASMKFARMGAAATAYGSYVLVFGGGDSANILHKEVEAYSPDEGKWKVLAYPTLIGRAFHHVAKVGSSVYVFGGITPIGPLPIIERYVPSWGVVSVDVLGQWNSRAYFGAVTRNDSVFVISGWGSSQSGSGYFQDIAILSFGSEDSASGQESKVSLDMPRRGFVAAASENGDVFLFGGISPDYQSGNAPIPTVTVLGTLTAVREIPNMIPRGFSLDQNYPNPFNPTTTIHFDVPPPGSKVSLNVYNMLGQKVKTLAGGYMHAGSYSVSFDGENMPSGAYIYRLETENGSIYGKMVLIK